MNLAQLVLQPRRFFERQGEPINRVWPLAGFYVFAFAGFFQQSVAREYRVPYWLVVFVVAWAPALMLMTGLFVLLVLLWYWPASNLLGRPQTLARSTQLVGVCLLPPGLISSVFLLLLATAKSNGAAAPYPLIVAGVQAVSALWGFALVILAAAVRNNFTTKTTVLFVLWLAAPAALVGALAYAVAERG